MAKILLLEDEVILRMMLSDLLEAEGHNVLEAGDGLPAFDTKIIADVDLMITDLFMPNIDGMEAIMNARKAVPDLRIIAMSAGAEFLKQDFLPHTMDFGASAILRKPFKPQDFLETVTKTLALPASSGNLKHEKALAS